MDDCFRDISDRHELSRILIEQREILWSRAAELTAVELMSEPTDLTDGLVRRIFEHAAEGAAPSAVNGIAIASVGGYGRREMAPYSDVDVAFLAGAEEDDDVDLVVKRAFRLLMDVLGEAGLKVGYSYRSIGDVEHLPLEVQTALMDARCIAGSESVFVAFQSALRGAIVPIAFVTAHAAARASASDTPFAVEPDIKEGAGGLRDLHAARWIAQVAFGFTNGCVWDGLRANGIVTDANIEEMRCAHEFLSRTRNALHLGAGYARDVLSSTLHADIAEAVGIGDPQAFLADYYSHAHALSKLLAKVADASTECELAVEPGMVARNGRLSILDRGLLARDPAATIRLFQHSQMHHLTLSRDTVDLVSEQGRSITLTPKIAHIFLDVLGNPGAGGVLRMMAEAGVLQAIVPQFDELMYLVPGDAAHKYTVGEHTLRTVETLEALFSRDNNRLSDIFSRLQHLEVLFLAALLHDIGKLDSGKDHAKSGAFRASKLARSLGMPDDAVKKVEFLVRNHMKMSETARLRDLQQKKTIADFAALVRDPQLLDMLFLLTLADSRSVGSKGWTQVQTRFLHELHERAMSAIRSPDAAGPDIERHRKRVRRELCLSNLPSDEVDEHCESMPASYLLNTPPDVLAAHIGYVRTVREGSCVIETTDAPGGHFTELTIAAMDQPGLLSKIAGVLDALNIHVHAAQVFTRHSTDNIGIDLLYVDFEGRQLAETRKWQLEAELTNVLSGGTSVKDLLRRMGKKDFHRPEETTVRVLENLSDHHTFVEIRTEDSPGLLYYLTRVITEQGFNIHSARIATWGHEARDAFYITNPDGTKLSASDLSRLSAAL